MESSNRAFILVVVGLIVAGLLGVAFLATSRDSVSGDVNPEQTAEVEIEGSTLPLMPEGVQVSTSADDPAIGLPAPTLTGTDFADNEITIGADGRAKVIYFIAHWCGHCQQEVPRIQELIDEGSKPDDFDVYAVSTGVDEQGGNYPPEVWFTREGFTPVTIRDNTTNTSLLSFGGAAYPYAVYLDSENNVVARTSGGLEKSIIASLWETTASL
jgi:thiol-disulfide isomerase/thioredoxin